MVSGSADVVVIAYSIPFAMVVQFAPQDWKSVTTEAAPSFPAMAGGAARSGWLSAAVFRWRSTRTRPEVVHRFRLYNSEHSPQSQKYLLGKEFIANAPSSGRNCSSACDSNSSNSILPSRK